MWSVDYIMSLRKDIVCLRSKKSILTRKLFLATSYSRYRTVSEGNCDFKSYCCSAVEDLIVGSTFWGSDTAKVLSFSREVNKKTILAR